MALVTRIIPLFSPELDHRTAPLFSVLGRDFAGRDLILITGGLFLLGKANHGTAGRGTTTFGAVIVQILVLDAVFSLDSVVTAVGMVEELWGSCCCRRR